MLAAMSNAVIHALEAAGIAHRLVRYDPALEPAAAAEGAGLSPDVACKTLAVASMPAVVLAVLPANARLDLTALCRHLAENRTMLIEPQALQRMTGFADGAVTPLPRAGARRFRVILEERAMALPELAVGGGEAGLGIVMTPAEFVRATDAEMAAIVEEDGA